MTPDWTDDRHAVVRSLRQRWVTGVAIATVVTGDRQYRGITVSSYALVSETPPIVAIAFARMISFHESLAAGGNIGISILDWEHEFLADRFAGRGPVPDAGFTGIPHDLLGEGVPVLRGTLARCVCRITHLDDAGDHLLMLAEVTDGDLLPDTGDPLLRYEGRYRRLEAE